MLFKEQAYNNEEESTIASAQNELFTGIKSTFHEDSPTAFLSKLRGLPSEDLNPVLLWISRNYKSQAKALKQKISESDQKEYADVLETIQPLWEEVTLTEAVHRDAGKLFNMKLWKFRQYADSQADWLQGIEPSDRATLVAILNFTKIEFILSGCETMRIQDLLNQGLVDNSGKLVGAKVALIKWYCAAVQGHRDLVDLRYPTNGAAQAFAWAAAMQKLVAALGGPLVHQVMKDDGFKGLVQEELIDDFIAYYRTCNPYLHATNGAEVDSYLRLRAQGGNPLDYAKSPHLQGNIRNFHRFTKKTLDGLERNYQNKAKNKPLTLILHSALDESGSFHQDANLESVILNDNILALMIEGRATLEAVGNDIAQLAQTYGRDGKIDQVMFIGHGGSRSMEMAGPLAGYIPTTAQQDYNSQYENLPYQKGDEIKVSEFSTTTGDGKGETNGQPGRFNIHHTTLADKMASKTQITKTFTHDEDAEDVIKIDGVDVINKVEQGTTVTVFKVNFDTGWAKVLYQGQRGWIETNLMGQPQGNVYVASATADFNTDGSEFPDTEEQRFLRFKKGDVIFATKVEPWQGWGQGTCGDRTGWFRLIYTDIQQDESLNLDKTAERTTEVFDKLLEHMATDPQVNPHRRIVFNACLTNSNVVKVSLPTEQELAQQKQLVRDHIELNPSLTRYLQDKINSNEKLKEITVLGASGSIRKVKLIDEQDGLTLQPYTTETKDDPHAAVTLPDPEVTNPDKLVYIREGQEPEGVLGAVLECWAEDEQGSEKSKTYQAIQDRYDTIDVTTWERAVIKSLFGLCLEYYYKDGEKLRRLRHVATALTNLQAYHACSVSSLLRAGLGPGDSWDTDVSTIFTELLAQQDQLVEWIPLVIYQVWMKHDTAKGSAFLAALTPWSCASARQFLDLPFIAQAHGATIESLLPLGKKDATSARLILALVTLYDNKHPHCQAYLKQYIDPGTNRFSKKLKVPKLLQGNPSEQEILHYLDVVHTAANLDLDGDGINETYIEPLASMGKVVLPARPYQNPFREGQSEQDIEPGAEVLIIGKKASYYVIEYPHFPAKVAFIHEQDIQCCIHQ